MKLRVVLGLVAVVAIGGAVWIFTQSQPPATTPSVDAGPVEPAEMTDEEREAYVKQFVEVRDVNVGPDYKPNAADAAPEAVVGLMRVTGRVHNKGERAVASVEFSIVLMDAAGEAIAAYPEDALQHRKLEPGEARSFSYTIPANKDFAGKFEFKLR